MKKPVKTVIIAIAAVSAIAIIAAIIVISVIALTVAIFFPISTPSPGFPRDLLSNFDNYKRYLTPAVEIIREDTAVFAGRGPEYYFSCDGFTAEELEILNSARQGAGYALSSISRRGDVVVFTWTVGGRYAVGGTGFVMLYYFPNCFEEVVAAERGWSDAFVQRGIQTRELGQFRDNWAFWVIYGTDNLLNIRLPSHDEIRGIHTDLQSGAL
ncbi:MAG: hypothetical protein FWC70_12800 [Defluviitaleaceae bacterium]|nr:hypothetical protein [Defluviitaleaceae bacterium]